jgi:predicted acylesterase/phospholipase RssA
LILAAAWLAGCSGPSRPRPEWESTAAIRIDTAIEDRRQQEDWDKAFATLSSRTREGGLEILALSAGGQSGAFGAGLMQGWTEAGSRPEFDLVTGVSTGALIGVFAFLGPEFDSTLKDVYTKYSTSDVLTRRWWIELPFTDSYARSSPLRSMLAKYVPDELVERIGAQSARGRVFLVATANMDLDRMRVWNMTALAADQSLPLSQRGARFRQILAASLSIPTLVNPQFIDSHMHADAGLIRQVFLSDPDHTEDFKRVACAGGPPRIWTIVNRRLSTPPKVVDDHIIDITSRSVQMLVDSSLSKDVEEVQRLATECKGQFSLAALPIDPARKDPSGMFDREYMRLLNDLGSQMARSGQAWSSSLRHARSPLPEIGPAPTGP